MPVKRKTLKQQLEEERELRRSAEVELESIRGSGRSKNGNPAAIGRLNTLIQMSIVTLVSLMSDDKTPPAVKLGCAKTILTENIMGAPLLQRLAESNVLDSSMGRVDLSGNAGVMDR